MPSDSPPRRARHRPERDGRRALAGLSYEGIEETLAAEGLPASHAARLAASLLRGADEDLAAVPGLGPRVAGVLERVLAARTTRVESRTASPDGTVKLLLGLEDGERVETVLLRLARSASGCLSSQVGCAAACAFCASGLDGLRRSLSAAEIVEQVVRLRSEAAAAGTRLGNVVFMGMGEPLHAYDSVVEAIRLLTDPRLLGFGCGHVTVSTVGVVPGILALAEEGLGVHLAVSIHAANDALRRTIVPLASRWSVEETLDAAERFRVRTGRFVTVQATLLDGVNDAVEHAGALARAIGGRRFHVNLIPWNPVERTPFSPSPPERVAAFSDALLRAGAVVHVRTRRGGAVDAACGQLRRRAATPRAE
jgi:23S rRNA (adenine2503-C2)-methyltransferase